MSILVRGAFLLAIICMAQANDPPRIAAAQLSSQPLVANQLVTGSIIFTETDNGLRIVGTVAGLPAGKYKLQIHELGVIATCAAVGGQLNPAGDLGNMEYTEATAGTLTIDITESVLTLRGENNILGRSVNLLLESSSTGVACGVVGIAGPADAWNSAATGAPSLLLFLTAALLAYFRY